MSALIRLVLVFTFANKSIEAARILAVFPTPSISHQVVFRPLTQELARCGHEVVVITPDPAFLEGQAPSNLTEINVHDLSYSAWRRFVETSDGIPDNWVAKIEKALNLLQKIFEQQMKAPAVQETIFAKNAGFDLLLAEGCLRSVLGLSHVFKVPTILVSSFGLPLNSYEIVGTPFHPFQYPALIRDRIYNLTIWEKVIQLNKEIQNYMLLKSNEESEDAQIKQLFGPDTPTLNELYNNIEMLFVNVHPIWEDNRPVPPNVIFMGGLHQNEPKNLPKEIQTFLDSSTKGVIYVSFGTNVQPSLLPLEKIETMTKVFSRLPYDILWKWDKDDLPGRTKNIKISKWLPQSDLLRHPKIKLFITQGGLQSTDEAITAGVPLIGIPMLADQWYNVEKYVRHQIGLRLDMEKLNEQSLENAIKTVIQDKRYRDNIARLRMLMTDQPEKPLDRAVWWTEYVLRHGNARHLRSPTANMCWADYFEWKLVCLLVSLSLLSLFAFYAIISSIYKFIACNMLHSIKIKMS